jgi:cysteine desulfuration protein SufE
MGLPPVSEILDEYELLEGEDRYRLLIDLGRKLEPMPDALKTEATKVRGCSASVWVYPTKTDDHRLHFLADSNAAITKGIVALVLSTVQDKPARRGREIDIAAELAPFELAPAERQPHPGRSEHDPADPRNRSAARRMSGKGFDPKAIFRACPPSRPRPGARARVQGFTGNWAELSLPWREELVGVPESGILASGAIVSLIDTASGTSVWVTLDRLVPILTVDLRLDYLRPAVKGETIIARCECVKLTRRIAFVRGIAHGGDETRPIALSASTFMLNR